MQKITTFLTYDNQAEEAARYYLSVFESGKITSTMPGPGGSVMSVTFELFGQNFIALNGGPTFTFSQGMSLFVSCENQAEIDRYWAKLTDGGKEIQCGWITDKFGVCWQIIPKDLPELLAGGRAVPAMMQMKKLDIAALKKARDGQ
jgi:predicted 3-demethylubiquinone-9 3-methyltransferase (glyoxalase superfamily)